MLFTNDTAKENQRILKITSGSSENQRILKITSGSSENSWLTF